MSGLRRSTRSTTSTINVKLNEQNEIEYFKVENDGEDGAEDEMIIGDVPNDMELDDDDDDDHDNDEDGAEHGEDDEEEEEEADLIANPDGTMSIKIAEKKPKKAKVPVHLICAKCSKVLSSGPVSQHNPTV